jgi:type IV pilus biogenesis protein CpaD/CtpE
MSSLRNSSYELRDTIPNPINVVGPWNQSTIDPDIQRRPLNSYLDQDSIYGTGNACSWSPSESPINGTAK